MASARTASARTASAKTIAAKAAAKAAGASARRRGPARAADHGRAVAPIMTLAITSPTISLRQLSDLSDTVLTQRLSEVAGVGKVTVQGNIRPAVRIQVDLARLSNYGISLEDVRQVIVAANVAGPK